MLLSRQVVKLSLKKKDNEQQYTNDGKEARNVLIRN